MAIHDVDVLPVAQNLLACLKDQVAMLDKPPKRVGLRVGEQIQFHIAKNVNECCEGLAWVRIGNKWPSTQNFPQPDSAPQRCAVPLYAVQLELGVSRCAPVGSERSIPSVDDWNRVAEQNMHDAAALERAVCCFRERYRLRSVEGTSEPLGPEGGCVGRTLPLTVAVKGCNCAVEDASPGESPPEWVTDTS